jgi:hypothetical protein
VLRAKDRKQPRNCLARLKGYQQLYKSGIYKTKRDIYTIKRKSLQTGIAERKSIDESRIQDSTIISTNGEAQESNNL